MIKRKLVSEKQEKKLLPEIATKKVKKGMKVEHLPDAIVNGHFSCPIGSELIIEKYRNGKNTLTVCTLKRVDEDGLVHTWDETVQQWYMFSLHDPPRVVKLSRAA